MDFISVKLLIFNLNMIQSYSQGYKSLLSFSRTTCVGIRRIFGQFFIRVSAYSNIIYVYCDIPTLCRYSGMCTRELLFGIWHEAIIARVMYV